MMKALITALIGIICYQSFASVPSDKDIRSPLPFINTDVTTTESDIIYYQYEWHHQKQEIHLNNNVKRSSSSQTSLINIGGIKQYNNLSFGISASINSGFYLFQQLSVQYDFIRSEDYRLNLGAFFGGNNLYKDLSYGVFYGVSANIVRSNAYQLDLFMSAIYRNWVQIYQRKYDSQPADTFNEAKVSKRTLTSDLGLNIRFDRYLISPSIGYESIYNSSIKSEWISPTDYKSEDGMFIRLNLGMNF